MKHEGHFHRRNFGVILQGRDHWYVSIAGTAPEGQYPGTLTGPNESLPRGTPYGPEEFLGGA